MQIFASFKQLYHVAFDLGLSEMYRWVLEEARKIVVHVRRYHEHARFLLRILAPLNSHLFQLEYVDMIELFEELDLS
jgi:hypothetical protein